jgi:hypothetical protein
MMQKLNGYILCLLIGFIIGLVTWANVSNTKKISADTDQYISTLQKENYILRQRIFYLTATLQKRHLPNPIMPIIVENNDESLQIQQ